MCRLVCCTEQRGRQRCCQRGFDRPAVVTRVKVVPPSVEHDMPEKLLKLAPRESLNATQIWSGLSGLAVVNVSDCVVLGGVSVPVTRLTSAAPNVTGARDGGSSFWTSLEKALVGAPFRRTSASLAAVKHEKSPFKVLHPVDALLVNGGTVKSRRKTLDVDNFVLFAALVRMPVSICGERAKANQRQRDAGQKNKHSD